MKWNGRKRYSETELNHTSASLLGGKGTLERVLFNVSLTDDTRQICADSSGVAFRSDDSATTTTTTTKIYYELWNWPILIHQKYSGRFDKI